MPTPRQPIIQETLPVFDSFSVIVLLALAAQLLLAVHAALTLKNMFAIVVAINTKTNSSQMSIMKLTERVGDMSEAEKRMASQLAIIDKNLEVIKATTQYQQKTPE